MTNYSDNLRMCRVDFFKPSGKWYMTEAVEFPAGFCDYGSPNEALAAALNRRYPELHAVCLFPYCGYDYPAFRPAKTEAPAREGADAMHPDSGGRPKCVPEGAHWMWTKLTDGTHAAIWLEREDEDQLIVYLQEPGNSPWDFTVPEAWLGESKIGQQAREDVIWFGRTYGSWT